MLESVALPWRATPARSVARLMCRAGRCAIARMADPSTRAGTLNTGVSVQMRASIRAHRGLTGRPSAGAHVLATRARHHPHPETRARVPARARRPRRARREGRDAQGGVPAPSRRQGRRAVRAARPARRRSLRRRGADASRGVEHRRRLRQHRRRGGAGARRSSSRTRPTCSPTASPTSRWASSSSVTRRITEGDRFVRAGRWKGWALDFMLGRRAARAPARHRRLRPHRPRGGRAGAGVRDADRLRAVAATERRATTRATTTRLACRWTSCWPRPTSCRCTSR